MLTGNAQTIGKALTDSEVVRKLTFTGSTEVGKMLLKECAKTVKRVSMELGGHAPFIVFEDANIESAVNGSVAGIFGADYGFSPGDTFIIWILMAILINQSVTWNK